MGKIHLDRLRKKYGFTGENYKKLMDKIITNNNENIARNVGRLSKDHWSKALKKISLKEKPFIIPSVQQAFPARAVFIKKGADHGTKITDTLRDSLTKNLRESLSQFTPKTGEATFIRRRGVKAGTINNKLINEFESKITKTFLNYRKKDPKIGMPKNVHEIAVTEFRGTVIEMKKSYKDELLKQNPDLLMTKTWIHNPSLSKDPRRGHRSVDGKRISVDKTFSVPLFKKIGKRWFKVGVTKMDRPYDPTAPLEQIIGCNCDMQYSARRKK